MGVGVGADVLIWGITSSLQHHDRFLHPLVESTFNLRLLSTYNMQGTVLGNRGPMGSLNTHLLSPGISHGFAMFNHYGNPVMKWLL